MRRAVSTSRVDNDIKIPRTDYSEPPKLEGDILLKQKEKSLHRTGTYYAILTRGFLRLFTNRHNEHYKYRIDLGKISLQEENGSLILVFKIELHVFTTVDVTEFPKWKDAIIKHHQYRKCLLRKRKKTSSECDTSPDAVDTSSDKSSDFEDWDTIDMCLKMIDDIQKMQGLAFEVLEKMEALCIDMRKVALELGSTVKLIQYSRSLGTETRSKISTTPTQITVESLQTTPSAPLFSYDDGSIGEKLIEFADDMMVTEVNSSTTLLSLNATSNVEKKKSEVIQNCQRILKKSVPRESNCITIECPTISTVPNPSKEAVTQSQAIDKVQENYASAKSSSRIAESSAVKTPVSQVMTSKDQSVKSPNKPQRGKSRREYRKALPAVQCLPEKIGFSALGRMILQRTGAPISHYEPLTFLQLLCEELKFSSLLNKACAKGTAEERMVYVAAFAVSPYTNSAGRYRKFFNPLLGETYEYEQEDFKYHGEQVSHHPSVSAGHAIGNGWTWFQTFSAEVTWNAWAQTCEFVPDKPIRLQLTGEEYMWNKITTHIESLLCVPEERKLYHEGTISVKCSNGVKATINVARNKEISGEIVNAEGKVFCTLSGKWDERLCREMDSGEKEQLIATSEWPIYRQYFGFTDFTMRLNELRDEDRAFLPPTDSRFRPDVRCLEYGNLDDALAYKKSMEQAQRDRAINEETYKPLWFVQKEDSFTNKTTYASTGKYWEAKETKFEKQKNDNSFIPIFTVSITK